MHSRDERCKNQAHHKAKPDPHYDKAHPMKPTKCYRPADFTYEAAAGTLICPEGKLLLSQFTQFGHCSRSTFDQNQAAGERKPDFR